MLCKPWQPSWINANLVRRGYGCSGEEKSPSEIDQNHSMMKIYIREIFFTLSQSDQLVQELSYFLMSFLKLPEMR